MLERRRILVWGKTRPELSRTYKETVCTGGVFDTGGLVRLYPIPLRFLEEPLSFAKYQWIEAEVERNRKDPRPESYRIRLDNMTVGEKVNTKKGGDWSARARLILAPENIVRSVEQLQAFEASTKRSLGILKPKEILGVLAAPVPAAEQEASERKWAEITIQQEMDFPDVHDKVIPLRPSEYKFRVKFRCDDSACKKTHEFGILDWEVDALYFRMKTKRGNGVAAKKDVLEHLQEKVLSPTHDTRLFLGNISTHPTNFTIVGLWYPKEQESSGFLF